MGNDADREKRLAEALRANLKRRKEQRRTAGADRASDDGSPTSRDRDDPS
jgi:hypothetical protein